MRFPFCVVVKLWRKILNFIQPQQFTPSVISNFCSCSEFLYSRWGIRWGHIHLFKSNIKMSHSKSTHFNSLRYCFIILFLLEVTIIHSNVMLNISTQKRHRNFVNQIFIHQNRARSPLRSQLLVLGSKLAHYAQWYAILKLKNCTLKHSNKPYNETFFGAMAQNRSQDKLTFAGTTLVRMERYVVIILKLLSYNSISCNMLLIQI